ncbi:MAG: protein kinase domain-containing protein [Cycloclasticus sp.]
MTKISPSPQSHLVAGNTNALSSGSVIDEYIIERVLAKGGFSTVYLARQLKDQQQVAIKEYNPKHLVEREGNTIIPIDPASAKLFQRGRELFLKEAILLTTLKHPNIVRVINFFLCNNTTYLVMNYDYGITLGNWLKNPEN